jgi:4-diphosphocytidyl-2C-methyl-D-erythritol kinase
LSFEDFEVSLIKPKNLGISAKEAYTKFSEKGGLSNPSTKYFKNDLEWAVIDDYKELQYIKNNYPTSMMSGSGSTYFMLDKDFEKVDDYWVCNGLKSIPYGVKLA